MTKTTPDCCEVWPRLRDHFAWFEFEDEPNCFVMPSLGSTGNYWRVNHCPSCGAKRRAAIWNRNDELEGQGQLTKESD